MQQMIFTNRNEFIAKLCRLAAQVNPDFIKFSKEFLYQYAYAIIKHGDIDVELILKDLNNGKNQDNDKDYQIL